jgi:hypothetical protein
MSMEVSTITSIWETQQSEPHENLNNIAFYGINTQELITSFSIKGYHDDCQL